MYDDSERFDWSDPVLAARLLMRGFRLPNEGDMDERPPVGGRWGNAPGSNPSQDQPGSQGHVASDPIENRGSIVQPAIDHAMRVARIAQRRPADWPRSEREPGWRSNGTYSPADVRLRADRARRFYEIFIKRKYSPDMAAALAANIEAESHGNYLQRQLPRRRGGPPGPGYGLIQWEPPRQARFLESFGYPIEKASEADQLDFIDIELAKPEYENGNARRIARERGAGNTAVAILRRYERPHEQQLAAIDRANLAEAVRRFDLPWDSAEMPPTGSSRRRPGR